MIAVLISYVRSKPMETPKFNAAWIMHICSTSRNLYIFKTKMHEEAKFDFISDCFAHFSQKEGSIYNQNWWKITYVLTIYPAIKVDYSIRKHTEYRWIQSPPMKTEMVFWEPKPAKPQKQEVDNRRWNRITISRTKNAKET